MKFYVYVTLSGKISLYGEKGYTFFHVMSDGIELKLDEPRIRYEFIDYGWREISAKQAAEVLRDMVAPIKRYRWLFNYEKIRVDEIRNLIEAQ